jgi:hypothetical protein
VRAGAAAMSRSKRVVAAGDGESGATRRVRKRRRPVKFIWGAGKVLPGRWVLGLFGYYTQDTGVRTEGLAVSIRGLLGWSALLALLVYAAGAAVLHQVWQRNPYSRLTYTDALLLPWRRSEIGRKQGQAFLAEGMAALEKKQWQIGVTRLQLGLARYPEDRTARITLARLYFTSEQREAALRLMADGVGRDYPGKDYLSTYFGWLEQVEKFAEIERVAERYSGDGLRPEAGADARWLAEWRYMALTASDRHAEALAVAESEGQATPAMERQVASLLALKRPGEALERLTAWRARAGGDGWRVSKLQAQALQDLGRWDEMEATIRELQILLPGEPGVPVFRIIQLVRAGRRETAVAALGDYIFRFGGAPQNLIVAAKPLAELGLAEGVQVCLAAARERGYPSDQLSVLLVQAQVANGDWTGARRTLEQVPPRAADPNWRELIETVTDAALSPAEPVQRALSDLLRRGQWRPQVLREAVAALLLADRLETARDVLAHAERIYPHVAWFGRQTKEVALQLMARAPAVADAPRSDGSPAVSEAEFGAELGRLVQGRHWTEATRLIQTIYRIKPTPDWLPRQEAAVRLAQVRIAQASSDRPALSTAARLFLNGDADRSARLLGLGQEFFDDGDAAAAVALAMVVNAREQGAADVERRLAEWAVRAPAAKAALELIAAGKERRVQEERLGEIRRQQELGNLSEIGVLARRFLNGEAIRRQQLSGLAEEFRRRGDNAAAETLTRELERARASGGTDVPATPAVEPKRGVGTP